MTLTLRRLSPSNDLPENVLPADEGQSDLRTFNDGSDVYDLKVKAQ
jgi:hypothetical protein